MNKNTEREYWARAVQEVLQASGLTLEALADRMGVSVRQAANWKAGQRPTGIVAIRFFEYRRNLIGEDISQSRIVLHCESTVG